MVPTHEIVDAPTDFPLTNFMTFLATKMGERVSKTNVFMFLYILVQNLGDWMWYLGV